MQNYKIKIKNIFLNVLPVIIMIGLIPVVKNDYLLTLVYIFIICISFLVKKEKNDQMFLIFGFLVMLISEAFFISTKVETFNRNSLFGLMPFWLPFLWGYAFVAIKRSINILGK